MQKVSRETAGWTAVAADAISDTGRNFAPRVVQCCLEHARVLSEVLGRRKFFLTLSAGQCGVRSWSDRPIEERIVEKWQLRVCERCFAAQRGSHLGRAVLFHRIQKRLID